MDKTLEIKLKTGMDTKLPTCHTGNGSSLRLVGDRVQRRWLSYGLTLWFESPLFDL